MSKRVVLFGASGTIGRAVARELRLSGHDFVCALRGSSNIPEDLAGYSVKPGALADVFDREGFDVAISCIASRTGAPEDAWAVDFQANSDILKAAHTSGVRHFVLLSAICVQKPGLAFQHAKLAFEKELIESGLTYSIVRPTAFFKSLSGQIERVRSGKPYLLFGNGELTRCKPISDRDLARFVVGCINDPERRNRILPVGGPGPAITPLQQGKDLFRLTGQKPRYRRVPMALMNVIVGALGLMGLVSERAAAKAEYAKIGRYYATESMLVWDEKAGRYDEAATPEFGTETLFEHYRKKLG
ncbi:NAD(P)H-binding protein [Altererythrobacter sp.]|uniref:NAD(P)H-binding protein n=1 Tax=Altererythrobacter sp. TaxID=1872480 RepID=UPI001B26EFAB|nr:NAD(P)H-binding protein [Altererythrobacter sp.]MBO6945041.1 NAD(P)H-binding protein [Altererythrobacter sp.]